MLHDSGSRQIKLNATGETILFTKTAADTQGEYLEFICFLPAGKRAAPPKHIHPFQTEYFECLEGELGVTIEKVKRILTPGQSVEVPAHTRHGWYAGGKTDIRFKTVFRPALHMEWLLTETFAAMNRNSSMRPPVFDACYILSRLKGEFYLAGVPIAIQKIAFPFLATVGSFLGLTKNMNVHNLKIKNDPGIPEGT